MRIRKRFPPSSLPSLPLSDPQLSRSPVVQHHHVQGGAALPDPDGNPCVQEGNTCSQPSDPPNLVPPPPSDQNPAIGSARPRWVCSDGKQKEMDGEEAREERLEGEEESKNTREGRIIGAELGSCLLPKASSSHQEVWTWYEGDKIVPLKKRRRSFESRCDDGHGIMEKETKRKTKMKSKTNMKCVKLPNGDEKGGKETELSIKATGLKKVKRGNVIMEGSRCSRVNGRGWRCCQPTLVGYSLCEHHLGKGRLRSMTSVRANAPKKDDEQWGDRLLSSSSSLRKEKWLAGSLSDDDDNEDEDEEDDEEEEKKPLMITKKRMKIGTVKARSMSSLLGQTNNAAAIASGNKKTTVYMNEDDNGKY